MIDSCFLPRAGATGARDCNLLQNLISEARERKLTDPTYRFYKGALKVTRVRGSGGQLKGMTHLSRTLISCERVIKCQELHPHGSADSPMTAILGRLSSASPL